MNIRRRVALGGESRITAATSPDAAAAVADEVARRVFGELGVTLGDDSVEGFYEANRRLIQTYREANRILTQRLSVKYREAHEELCRQYGKEIGELWV